MTTMSEHETVEDIQREDHIADLLLAGKSVHETAQELGVTAREVIKVADERQIFEGEQSTRGVTGKYADVAKAVVDHMHAHPESLSRFQLKALSAKLAPNLQPGRVIAAMRGAGFIEQDPQKNYVCYRLTGPTGPEPSSKPKTVVCECGKVLIAASPKTKIDSLVFAHTASGAHKDLTVQERYELRRKILPAHGWQRPEGAEPPRAREAALDVCDGCRELVEKFLKEIGLKPRLVPTHFALVIGGEMRE